MAAPVAQEPQQIPDDIAAVVRQMNQRNLQAGMDEQGNPKDPEAAEFMQAYQAKTQPHYDGNQLIPAPFKPVDLNPPSEKEAALRGAAKGATLGLQPILSGGVEAAQGAVDSLLNESNAFGDGGRFGGLSNFIENYRRARDTESAQNQRASEVHPYASGAAAFAGGTPLAIASAAPALVNAGVSGSAIPAFQRALNLATTAGLMGAVSGFANSKGDLTKGDVGKVAKDSLDSGLQTAAAAGLLNAVINSAQSGKSLADSLHETAANKAFEALKPTGKSATQLIADGRSTEIGQELLDQGLMGPATSRSSLLDKVQEKLKDVGENIGYFAREADKAVARDSSIKGVSVPELSSDIQKQVIEPLSQDPSTSGIADDVQKWVANLKDKYGEGEVSFVQAQGFKKSLNALKAKFGTTADTLSKDAFQQVYGILNDHIETGISNAFQKAAPELNNNFIPLKDSYRNLSDAEKILESSVAAQAKNRSLSPTDYAAGLAGVMAGQSHGLGPAAVLGAGLAGINHLARGFGNQAIASTLDTIANVADSSPEFLNQFVQKYGPIMKDAAIKNTILMKNMPNVSKGENP